VEKNIFKALDRIERDNEVKIILASESGSRAWGFPSLDSDYDVRFIYAHRRDWYLSILKRREVIELPISGDLDVSGWDFRKALMLMRKSNAPLMEWLISPMRYRAWSPWYECLLSLSSQAFLPEAACWHYLSMARKKMGAIEAARTVLAKRYMYAIRATLCCQWIIDRGTQPPMELSQLLAGVAGDGAFVTRILELIQEKKCRSESFEIARSSTIDTYLRSVLAVIESDIPKNSHQISGHRFDRLFRSLVSSMAQHEPDADSE
jgi:predicted nucleotidyltransferase